MVPSAVPSQWDWECELLQARAIRAGYNGDADAQSEYFLRAYRALHYDTLEQACTPLAAQLAPLHCLKEPPHYIEAMIDLRPSAWLITERLGVDPRVLEHLGDAQPLRFRVQVEIWADGKEEAGLDIRRYRELLHKGKEIQVDALYINIRPAGDDTSWRLDLAQPEAQSALLKALQLPDRLTVHAPPWQPMPRDFCATPPEEISLRGAWAHVVISESRLFERLEDISIRDAMPARLAPYHDYMRVVRGLLDPASEAVNQMKMLETTTQLLQNGSYWKSGCSGDRGGVSWSDKGTVPPSREETLPVRAALDHIGCHLLQQIPDDEETMLECVSKLKVSQSNIKGNMVVALPASESSRAKLLHRACDGLFT